MLFHKYINELKFKIEKMERDIENKENTIINLLEANKELSLSNNYLENKAALQKKVIIELEANERKLNKKLNIANKKINKIEDYMDMLVGEQKK